MLLKGTLAHARVTANDDTLGERELLACSGTDAEPQRSLVRLNRQ